ncbi:hypothetical protein D7B24_003233 [Verticillium nonalfalfae]|uniref:Monooxygenase n=1 Tax=Verticillium nonalfalfae TaxID=1051616 RepID=A0A3M9YJ62_9PEZI|nr:uncharacterized protein D7B24_003233 [Verticillium nonalfalfae]RNJ59140.1 hypothetical protein D7B24_003233 [Verticillium nonalfalfae]
MDRKHLPRMVSFTTAGCLDNDVAELPSGSDVPIHLYSFSFNLNPNWTQALADQEEILEYIESTVDKFHLRKHFCFGIECLGAEWIQGAWKVRFRDVNSGQQFTEQCAILLSAVGGFAVPREARFPGLSKFKGHIFHTAEWNHSFDYTNKRIAVIGNGCSAAQVVPAIAPSVKKITQYARSPQWYHPRPNKLFTPWEKFCFKYIPLWQRWHRLDLFLKTDQLASVYGSNASQVSARLQLEDEARRYILREAPERYHDFIVPKFPLGCKRRIYDPGYLASLRRDNVELLAQGIREFTETGLVSEDGVAEDFDAVSLHEQWEEHRGAQAYMGTFVHNHPNFAILFGPNTFPAFNSVIYSIEVQVDYIANVLMKPIIDGYASTIEVSSEAEETFVRDLDIVLAETVFAAGCSNWYINSAGRNSAAWPGLAATFWKATYFPRWTDFSMKGGSVFWPVRKLGRHVLASTTLLSTVILGAVVGKAFATMESLPQPLRSLISPVKG